MESRLSSLIEATRNGDRSATEALFSELYAELHRLAKRELARRGSGLSLSVTTLLHEAYLAMAGRDDLSFPDRARFMGYAARAMRTLIIDHARERQAQKRGGLFEITSLDTDAMENAVDHREEPESSQTGLRRRGESPVNCHRETNATAPVLDSTPTSSWIIQQLREAFPFGEAPRFLIHDRDAKYGTEVPAAIRSMKINAVRTSFESPWQNGIAERWVGSCRRELLDHVIALNERHLKRLLSESPTITKTARTLGWARERRGAEFAV